LPLRTGSSKFLRVIPRYPFQEKKVGKERKKVGKQEGRGKGGERERWVKGRREEDEDEGGG
jgi:hypothetical protein